MVRIVEKILYEKKSILNFPKESYGKHGWIGRTEITVNERIRKQGRPVRENLCDK